MNIEISKISKITAWTIAGLLTALLLFSATGKLFLHPEKLEQMNLGDWRSIIAIGEIISALMFLFPKTNKYGSLLLSSYMGGAIVANMIGDTSIIMPSVILVLIWVVLHLRNPDFFRLK